MNFQRQRLQSGIALAAMILVSLSIVSPTTRATDRLMNLTPDVDDEVRMAVVVALGKHRSPKVDARLRELSTNDPSLQVRARAIKVLASKPVATNADAPKPKRSPNPLVTVLQPVPEKAVLDAEGEVMPIGMVQRLGSTRFKVPGWWRRLGFAGKDEWVWLKADERVSVIHRETGRVVKHQQLRLGDGSVRVLTTSPDGTQVAIGMFVPPFPSEANQQANYRVVVMSALTTAHLQEMKWTSRPADLNCISFSGDGGTLLTGDSRGDVRLWDVETGKQQRQQAFEQGADLRDAAMSPDGRSVVLGGRRMSFFWKLDDNAGPIKLANDSGDSVSFAPNGRLFSTIGREGPRLWNAENGELIAHLKTKEFENYSDADFGHSFTSDSRLLAVPVSAYDVVELWDVETKQRVATLPVHQPRGVAISRDGRWLAASGQESFTAIFDLKTRQQVNQPGDGHSQEVLGVRFAGNGAVVSASDGDARVWDIKSGKQQKTLPHPAKTTTVRGLATSPDGTLIVTSAFDDTLGLWDRATGKRLFTLKGHGNRGGTRAARFKPDGSQFVSWGDDAVLRWWNAKDGSLVAAHPLDVPGYTYQEDGQNPFDAFSLCAAFAPDTKSLFVVFDKTLSVFDTQTGKRLREVPIPPRTKPLAVSADGRWLAAGESRRDEQGNTTSTAIVLRDRVTLKVVREWPVSDPREAAANADPDRKPSVSYIAKTDSGMAFSPDSRFLAWSRIDARPGIDIVEVAHDRLHASIPIESPCWCLDFSLDGKQLAVGHADSTISVWNPTQPAFVVGRALLPVDDPEQRRAGVPVLQESQLGTLSGRFLYDGEPPVPKDLSSGFGDEPSELQPGQRSSGVAMTYHHYLALKIRPSTTDPSLLVGKDGGIANVIVWVVSKEIPWTAPKDGLNAATIRAKDGNYSPRITAVTVGQPLHIENHDPIPFNFHLSPISNDPVNVLLSPKSTKDPLRLTFRKLEKIPVTFRSDQAIWATGFLLVRDNPFVAISQPDGSFAMPNLPPGEWEFRAWHERKGYVQHWPKGLFKHTIKPGDNNLGTIKLKPELFVDK